MSEFFKPEDFNFTVFASSANEEMANQANKLLKERGTIVYGEPYKANIWGQDRWNTATNQALLINIEEIPKKICEHWPTTIYKGVISEAYGATNDLAVRGVCRFCGINLKAKWEPA